MATKKKLDINFDDIEEMNAVTQPRSNVQVQGGSNAPTQSGDNTPLQSDGNTQIESGGNTPIQRDNTTTIQNGGNAPSYGGSNSATNNVDGAATNVTNREVTDVTTNTATNYSDDKITYCSLTIKIDADLMEKLDFIKHKFKRETVKTNKRDKQDVISAAIEDFLLQYWDEKHGLTKEGYDRVGEYLRGVRKV